MKIFYKQNCKMIILIVISLIVIFIQHEFYKKDLSKMKLYESMVNDIKYSNMLYSRKYNQLEKVLHVLSLQNIIEFGSQKYFHLNELDFTQQVSLCISYTEEIQSEYKNDLKKYLNNQNREDLLLGLKNIDNLCKKDYIIQYLTQ